MEKEEKQYLQISMETEKGRSEVNCLGKKRRGRDVISSWKIFYTC